MTSTMSSYVSLQSGATWSDQGRRLDNLVEIVDAKVVLE